MRAAWYDRPGPAREVFSVGELPCPPARPGELLVEVRASGINPSDYKQRANGSKALTAERTVPHSDGAGIVVAVGAGVDPARIGSAVWIWNAVHRHGYDAPAP
ncbi:MAG: alcohol dehydrogenase catalytic domain-containing protein, partial [Mycobacterium sp.]